VPLAVPASAIVIAIMINVLWGANPIAVKYSLLAFPPLWTGFFRFAVGAVCVFAWARYVGVSLWPERNEWRPLILISALFTIQIALMNIGFAHTSASMGAVLIATNPVFAALFAHFMVTGDSLTRWRCLGLAVAMIGTAVCLLQGTDIRTLDFGAIGNWIVLTSACLLGLRLSVIAAAVRKVHETRIVVWQMLLSLPAFAAGGLLFETIIWQNIGWQPIAGILYQGVIIAGLSFTVLYWLMKRYSPSVIVGFNFVSPVAGVLLAVWLLDETVTWTLLVGMVLVALGLALISRR
jgi:drug/metabolite transporter (DMT)-like permease